MHLTFQIGWNPYWDKNSCSNTFVYDSYTRRIEPAELPGLANYLMGSFSHPIIVFEYKPRIVFRQILKNELFILSFSCYSDRTETNLTLLRFPDVSNNRPVAGKRSFGDPSVTSCSSLHRSEP